MYFLDCMLHAGQHLIIFIAYSTQGSICIDGMLHAGQLILLVSMGIARDASALFIVSLSPKAPSLLSDQSDTYVNILQLCTISWALT